MAQSVKISDLDMELVRREAELSNRSIAGQLAHWMRIGRAIENAPRFSHARIRAALRGGLSPDALGEEEQEIYLADLLTAAEGPTAEQERFFEKRRREGKGVGADARGRIVRQAAKSRK